MDDDRGAERRCGELLAEQDTLKTAWQQMADELAAAKEDSSRASKELAAHGGEKRELLEQLQRTEAKLQVEQAAHRSDVEAAEQRCAEATLQRDEALTQRARSAEALAIAEAGRRNADEAMLKLTAEVKAKEEEEGGLLQRLQATGERNRELMAKVEFAEAALKEGEQARSDVVRDKAALAQELASKMAERRGKEQRIQDELQAVRSRAESAEERCAELTMRQDVLQAERARLEDLNYTLRNERDRLEQDHAAMQEEKRGLEEFALYVNTKIRSGSSPAGSTGKDGHRSLHSTPSTASHRPFTSSIAGSMDAALQAQPRADPQVHHGMRYGVREQGASPHMYEESLDRMHKEGLGRGKY